MDEVGKLGIRRWRRYQHLPLTSELDASACGIRTSVLAEQAPGTNRFPNIKNTESQGLGIFYGGGSWIRTSEVSDNRFTVCPLWPLGNSPIEYGAGERSRTINLLITNQLLCH